MKLPKHSPRTRPHRNFPYPVRDASLGNTEQRHNNPCIPLGMQPSQTHKSEYNEQYIYKPFNEKRDAFRRNADVHIHDFSTERGIPIGMRANKAH